MLLPRRPELGWQHSGMVGKLIRTLTGLALVCVAVASGVWAGGSGWEVVVATGVGGAVGSFAPGWVIGFDERVRSRAQLRRLAGPPLSGSLVGLLRPERGVVPFIGREAELTALLAWCADPAAGTVRLLVGAGGVGKSRLAGRVAERLTGTGWVCSWVGEGLEAEAWEVAKQGTSRPVLLLLDYAEARSGLPALLRSVCEAERQVKLLLLARGVGEWWDVLASLEEPVRTLVERAGPVALGTDLGAALTSIELIDQAVPHFARALGVEYRPPDGVVVPHSVHGGVPVPVLVLHAAALLTLLGTADSTSTSSVQEMEVTVSGVLGALLGHERRFWASSRPESLAGIGASGCRGAVAMACLVAPVGLDEAEQSLRRVPEFADARVGVRRDAARWLHGLYPPQEDRWWGSLAPDLVAEHLVCEVLGESGELAGAYLGGLGADAAESALTVLARAAEHHTAAPGILERGIQADPVGLAVPATRVAVATGGVLGQVLERVFERVDLPWDELVRLGEAIPDQTVTLAAMNVAVTQRILAQLPPEVPDGELAGHNMKAALALSQAGHPAEALAPAQRAAEIYRQLAEADPDRYQADLAASLNNRGRWLGDLGRQIDALRSTEQAVEIYRQLAEADSDRNLAGLAQSLNNLGAWFAALGRLNDALGSTAEAVEIRRRLAQTDPDPRRLANLAQSLTNLGSWFAMLGRLNDAQSSTEQSVEIYRQLAEANPDRYLGDLAASLNNLGAWYAALELPDDALRTTEQAVKIRRRLAEANSDRFLGDLAGSLNNLGARLAELERTEEALPLIGEAVDVYRRLAEADPDRYLGDLVPPLNNLGARLMELERPDDALPLIEEAVDVCRRLAETSPDRYLSDLAGLLNNLSVCFAELKHPDDGLVPIEEAVEIRRQLTQADPDRYLSDLVLSLGNLSARLDELGKLEQAADVRIEVSNLRKP